MEKTGLYQEPRIDTDPVLEFKFVARSVKTIRMPVKTDLPAPPPAVSRVNAFPLGLLAVILLARWGMGACNTTCATLLSHGVGSSRD